MDRGLYSPPLPRMSSPSVFCPCTSGRLSLWLVLVLWFVAPDHISASLCPHTELVVLLWCMGTCWWSSVILPSWALRWSSTQADLEVQGLLTVTFRRVGLSCHRFLSSCLISP